MTHAYDEHYTTEALNRKANQKKGQPTMPQSIPVASPSAFAHDGKTLDRISQLRMSKRTLADEALAILNKAEKSKRPLTDEEQITVDRCMLLAEYHHELVGLSEQSFRSLGEQLKAVADADVNPTYEDPRLAKIHRRAAMGSNQAVPSDGGYIIAPEFAANILRRTYQTGQFLNRVTSIPITKPNSNALRIPLFDEQSRANGSRFGGVQSYWAISDGDTLTSSKPKYRASDLKAEKLTTLVYASDELLEDVGSLGAVIGIALTEELRLVVERACAFGSGAGQPLGYLNSNALVTVAKETGQASATIVPQNIVKMWSRCWMSSQSNAIWFVNQELLPSLLQLTIAVGTGGSETQLYHPSKDPENQPFGTMLGSYVVPVEWAAAAGSLGDISLADPSQFVLTQREGIQAAFSLHVKFATDECAFRFTWRVNGQPLWNTPVTPLNGTNAVSPFIALAAR